MASYYVNKNAQSNGDHEVHKSVCRFMPQEKNRIRLGEFNNCGSAVIKANYYYNQVNGCKHCSPNCHTS